MAGYGYGYGLGLSNVGALRSYDAVSTSYFTRAGITNATEKNAVDDFIIGAKADATIWAAIENGIVYLVSPTSYGAALYNAVNSNFTLYGGVAPSYSASNGLIFDGVTQYLQSDFIFSTDVTTQHKYTTIFTNKKTGDSVAGEIWGAFNSSTQCFLINPNGTTGLAALTDNSTAAQLTVSNAGSVGRFIFNCYNDGSREILRNELSKGTTATAGGGSLPSIECYLGARNNAGSPSRYYPAQITGFIQTTLPLTQAQSLTLTALLKTYNDNVISGGR